MDLIEFERKLNNFFYWVFIITTILAIIKYFRTDIINNLFCGLFSFILANQFIILDKLMGDKNGRTKKNVR